MTKRKCFSQAIVESISKIIGETVDGYTGSEIELFWHNVLYQTSLLE